MQDGLTIEIATHFGPRQMTRVEYVDRWRSHAFDLRNIGIDIVDQAAEKAGADWDERFRAQNLRKAE